MAGVGVLTCLGLALNTVIMVVIAGFHDHKITLEFNRYHEHYFEIILSLVCFGWGIWGLVYLWS